MTAKIEIRFWSKVSATYVAFLYLLVVAMWALGDLVGSWLSLVILCSLLQTALELLFEKITPKYFSRVSKELLFELRYKWESLLYGLLLWCFVNFHMVEKLPTSLGFARYPALLFVFPLWAIFTPMWLNKGN